MSNHEPVALLARRSLQAYKAYGTALFEFYRYVRFFEDCSCGEERSDEDRSRCEECGEISVERMQKDPDVFDGAAAGKAPLLDLFYRYLLMLQASRDIREGRVVEGAPLDTLIAALETWIAGCQPWVL
jgi:hypothetical protein